jgi:hypothetical protein
MENTTCGASWTSGAIFEKPWGLKPEVLHWIYTMAVRPNITYIALVQWPMTRLQTSKAESRKLQRMACLGVTGVTSSAPRAPSLTCYHVMTEAEPLNRMHTLHWSKPH